ncbi:hypothetical protein V501_06065 [Pseudogymnoascus sp. VKM F-4519 (FW-2642)]|nr:hypothetical protein V501_06065 [Pseudogymnoascus sp. VKM F-4519 (FW-2642)]
MPLPKSEYVSNVWRDGIFAGKVVFCTGGAGTICSAQVRALVHLGANAAIIGRNVEKTAAMAKDIETARKGSKVIGLGGVDVRSFESLTKAAEQTVKELGGIDYVIAGAAGNFLAPITGLSTNAFRTVMEIDVVGSFNTLKATLPYLLESAAANKNDGKNPNTGGRIIFVSATLHYAGTPFQTHVAAAKAAIDALSANAAIEFGPRGITSNIIAPGPIGGTEGMERLVGAEGMEASKASVPLGRYGLVKEIADATVYLLSDAGNYVNGDLLVVDGGSWRMPMNGLGGDMSYPRNVLTGEVPKGVKSGRKTKL